MTVIQAFIAISVVLITIVTYSALVVSSKQEQRMLHRAKADQKQPNRHYSPHGSFSFETSEDLSPDDDNVYELEDF